MTTGRTHNAVQQSEQRPTPLKGNHIQHEDYSHEQRPQPLEGNFDHNDKQKSEQLLTPLKSNHEHNKSQSTRKSNALEYFACHPSLRAACWHPSTVSYLNLSSCNATTSASVSSSRPRAARSHVQLTVSSTHSPDACVCPRDGPGL